MFLESPKGFLTFAFGAQTHVFGEPRRFPDICFWCPTVMFLESPEGFLTFVLGAQNSCFWRAQKVSWHLFLVPRNHVFGEPRWFPDICFWCPIVMFLDSPEGFLTFVFGAQNSCFSGAQKVCWHLCLVPKTHVFGEPRRFADICFWCPKLMFLESPEGFLTFCFWCPELMFLESPEGILIFAFGAHNSCFWRAHKISWHSFLVPKTHVFGGPEGFLPFVFGAQNSCFWIVQKVSWHLFLVPKTHVFGESRRFPDICFWCPKLMFLESPEVLLTFVFGAQNWNFRRAQKISWHLFLVPKTHVFG